MAGATVNQSIQGVVLGLSQETDFEFPHLFYRSSPRQSEVCGQARRDHCVSLASRSYENQWPCLPDRFFLSFQRPWESPQWSLCQMNLERA